jgi:subfamily B ATP-binding cassette protein MsbA
MKISPYSRIIFYVLPNLGFFLLSSLGYFIFAISQVGIADWFRQIVDYISQPDSSLNLYLPILLLILAFGRGIGYFIGNFFMALVSTRLVFDLRKDLFKSLIYLPSSFYDSNNSGHLLSRITFNVAQINEAGTAAITILVREGLIVLGLLGYLIYLNWQLTALLFLASPFILLVVSIAGKRMKRVSARIQNSMGDVTQVSSESISANKEVKIFGQQESEIGKFNSVNSNNRIQNLKLEITNSLQSPIIQIFLAIALAFITWVALDSSFFERMSPGTFIAFFGAAAMLPRPIRQLSMTNSMIQKGLAAAEVIFNQMDLEPEIDEGTREILEIEGDISFKNVNFSYSENEKVLDDVSFSISKGNTLAIVGQSGSGKSTMVNLIPRFYEILEGQIEIDNYNIKDIKLDNLRSLISIVSQNTVLFNDSIKNNISYAKPMASDEEIFEAAKNANAHEFIKNLSNGYNTIVGDDGTLLSGGQKQRIAIARALLKDAPIIILDEATSALDSESENQIQHAIENLKIGKTTIVIAHRLSTVENAEKIIVLKSGQIVESGTHDDLMNLEKSYFELYKNQFKDDVEPTKKKLPILKSHFALSEQKTSNFIEEAWYENKNWIKILLPISWLYRFLFKFFRNRDLASAWKPDFKTIVIGNLTVGGTGKTPLVIWLANELKKEGLFPGIVSRGYKGTANKPKLINQSSNPSDVGDEPLIIFNNTNCPVVVGPNRVEAAKYLIQNRQCNVLISDDGLQHFKLGRDIEIAMIDGMRKFGNNLLLPAGPLREPIKKLDQVDFVINTNTFHSKDAESKENNFLMTYKPISWVNLVTQNSIEINNWSKDRIVYGIAGIGNPNSFFSLLRSLDFQVIEKVFPDHHEFIDTDFYEMNDLPIVMTEKDAIKCKFLKNPNCWYLKIEPSINEDFKRDLFKKVLI